MSTINQVKTEIAGMLETALVGVGLPVNVVYDYRTMPGLASTYLILTYTGGLLEPFTATGENPHYDFALVVIKKHDNDETTLEAAENALNTIENTIYDTLGKTRGSTYNKIFFYMKSIRPPAPKEMPNVRYAELYIRVYI